MKYIMDMVVRMIINIFMVIVMILIINVFVCFEVVSGLQILFVNNEIMIRVYVIENIVKYLFIYIFKIFGNLNEKVCFVWQ